MISSSNLKVEKMLTLKYKLIIQKWRSHTENENLNLKRRKVLENKTRRSLLTKYIKAIKRAYRNELKVRKMRKIKMYDVKVQVFDTILD